MVSLKTKHLSKADSAVRNWQGFFLACIKNHGNCLLKNCPWKSFLKSLCNTKQSIFKNHTTVINSIIFINQIKNTVATFILHFTSLGKNLLYTKCTYCQKNCLATLKICLNILTIDHLSKSYKRKWLLMIQIKLKSNVDNILTTRK